MTVAAIWLVCLMLLGAGGTANRHGETPGRPDRGGGGTGADRAETGQLAVQDPHGGYSSSTELCASCHSVHKAPAAKLMNKESERQTCYTCHDADGGAINVRRQFGEQEIGTSTATSFHPVPEPKHGVRLACSDCHEPHAPIAEDTMLLRAKIGGDWVLSPPDAPIGNAFCYSCHGAQSDLPAPYGDHSAFEDAVHSTNGKVPMPDSGSRIKCLACHEPHGSDFRALGTADQEDLCFSCHTEVDPNTSGGTNPLLAFQAGPNDYATNDGTPVRIRHHPIASGDQAGGARAVECASCHNVHLAARTDSSLGSMLVDPTDTSKVWIVSWTGTGMTRGNISAWCETCHVSPEATQPVRAGDNVPYDVTMVNDTGDNAGGRPHDEFRAAEWDARATHGPDGARLACTACHDFHGSSNAFMLREEIVNLDGTVTHTLTDFDANAEIWQWRNFAQVCLTCHEGAVAHTEEQLAGGMVCVQCHYHTSGKL